MTQCCCKTHREDPQNFLKNENDALSTFQLLRGNTRGTCNQYHNATRVRLLEHPTNTAYYKVTIVRLL